jgi:N-acetylneuraminate synthase
MTEIIVEIGNSHEGSLGIAKSFVDMALKAKCQTVKFQMHIPEAEGMPDEPFRKIFSDQDKTRQDYWRRVGFSTEEWSILVSYVHSLGLEFLCTPFSVEAANWLFENNAVKRWKVGSGDAVNFPLIDYLVQTDLPLIISTGLVSWEEILLLKSRLVESGAWQRTTLLHCVSEYPVPLEKVGMNLIDELAKLGCSVGYSDHSGKLAPGLLALAKGVSILEVHMAPHELFFGPDTPASLNPSQIDFLNEFNLELELMRSQTITRDDYFSVSETMRNIFRKGVYWSRDLDAGEIVSESDLIYRKPVNGFDSKDFEKIIGRQLSRKVSNRSAVSELDFLG